MGDWFSIIADIDAIEGEAENLALKAREWMTARGIIQSETSDCVMGDPTGYAPGPNCSLAIDSPDTRFLTLRTNGVNLISKKTVFHAGGLGYTLVCEGCGARFDGGKDWSLAVDQWYSKGETGDLACRSCGLVKPITEWKHDPTWAFGNLGIWFWNWPPLSSRFVDEVRSLLSHRIRVVVGKL